jgi:hypothetical protein
VSDPEWIIAESRIDLRRNRRLNIGMNWRAAFSVLIVGTLVGGCAGQGGKDAKSKSAGSETIVTPDATITAKVVSYNSVGRFVVLNFPAGAMPKIGQSLFLYRNGLKAGEVKIDTWQREDLVIADVVKGDAQVGDEARNQ